MSENVKHQLCRPHVPSSFSRHHWYWNCRTRLRSFLASPVRSDALRSQRPRRRSYQHHRGGGAGWSCFLRHGVHGVQPGDLPLFGDLVRGTSGAGSTHRHVLLSPACPQRIRVLGLQLESPVRSAAQFVSASLLANALAGQSLQCRGGARVVGSAMGHHDRRRLCRPSRLRTGFSRALSHSDEWGGLEYPSGPNVGVSGAYPHSVLPQPWVPGSAHSASLVDRDRRGPRIRPSANPALCRPYPDRFGRGGGASREGLRLGDH